METTLSNVVGFTMKKRARVTIKTPVLPSGTAGVGIYLSKGATKPNTAALSMTAQGAGTGSPPSKLIRVAAFTPFNNPTANAFGSGVPAVIQSDDATSIVLKADGSWSLVGVGSHVAGGTTSTVYDTGWQTWTLGTGDAPFGGTSAYSQWRRVGNQYYLRVQRTTNASYSPTATDGNYGNLNINNAANIFPPTNPDQNVVCDARFDDVPISVVLTTGGNLTLTGGLPGRVYASGSSMHLNATWIL